MRSATAVPTARQGAWRAPWGRGASLVAAAVLTLGAGTARGQTQPQSPRNQRQTLPDIQTPRNDNAAAPQLAFPMPQQLTGDDLESSMRARFASPDLLDAPVDPDTYTLGPSDLLAVMLLVGETRTYQLPVLPEGVVMVPSIGPIAATGKTLTEFRKALQAAVSKRYHDYELYCYLAHQRQYRVYVTGEVKQPGVLAARASERVSDLIDRSGGFTDRGSKREIELRDANGAFMRRVDLARFLTRGDLEENPHLGAGQVVRVPPRGRTVLIAGEVRAPGTYEARHGESLRDMLDLAGGLTPVADLSRVTLERTDSTGAVNVTTYDLRHDSPQAEDVTRVSVLSSLLGKRRVFFISPDERQQPIFLSPGETLADLVRRTATLSPEADFAAARLATRDSTGKPIQVPVDLSRVLAGEQDRPLRDGDVLSVPGVKDYVYVSGYVARPGRYTYRPEWTVSDYIGEAGGPAGGGSRDHAVLLGRQGSQRPAERQTSVQRGETLYIDRSVGAKLTGALGVLVSVSALAISLVALTRH